MIGGDLNGNVNGLSFCVCLRDEAIFSVFARVDVFRICDVVSVSTNAAFAFVLLPLYAETATVQLIIRILHWPVWKIFPGGVSAGRVNHHSMAKNQGDHIHSNKESNNTSQC